MKIVNNKGQSPRSLAFSHCEEPTLQAIIQAEGGGGEEGWTNYRTSHSDGVEYGDLDPRFIERALRPSDVVTPHSINPTSGEWRMEQAEQRREAKRQERDAKPAASAGEEGEVGEEKPASSAHSAPSSARLFDTLRRALREPRPDDEEFRTSPCELREARAARAADALVASLSLEAGKWLPPAAE